MSASGRRRGIVPSHEDVESDGSDDRQLTGGNVSSYEFYAAQLRFVAARTERQTTEITAMMLALERFAEDVERSSDIVVVGNQVSLTGRALAGVAGFLQRHILPETVAVGNASAERQVRWVIDTSMALTATLTVHGETQSDGVPCLLMLPPPPSG